MAADDDLLSFLLSALWEPHLLVDMEIRCMARSAAVPPDYFGTEPAVEGVAARVLGGYLNELIPESAGGRQLVHH